MKTIGLKARFVKVASDNGTQNLALSYWEVYGDEDVICKCSVEYFCEKDFTLSYENIATQEFGWFILDQIKICELSHTMTDGNKKFVFAPHELSKDSVWVEAYEDNNLKCRRLRPVKDNKIDWMYPISWSEEDIFTPEVRKSFDKFLKMKAFW